MDRAVGSYRRWTVLCAAVQAASFVPLVAAALSPAVPLWLVFAAAVVYWAAGMSASPAWNAWIANLVPVRIRSGYFSARQSAMQLGVMLGLVIGGLALDHANRAGDALPAFAGLFAFAFACRVLSGAFIAHTGRDAPMPPPPPRATLAEIAARLYGHRQVIACVVAAHAATHFAGPFFTPYMLDQLELPYHGYMVLLSAVYASKILLFPVWGRAVRRIGVRPLLALGAVGIAPVPALWAVSDALVYLFVLQIYTGVAWAAFELALFLTFFNIEDEAGRSTSLAVFNAVNSVAVAVSSLAGGVLLAALGADRDAYLTLFQVSTVGRVLAVAVILWPRPQPSGAGIAIPAFRILAVRPSGGALLRPVVATLQRVRRRRP